MDHGLCNETCLTLPKICQDKIENDKSHIQLEFTQKNIDDLLDSFNRVRHRVTENRKLWEFRQAYPSMNKVVRFHTVSLLIIFHLNFC